MKNACCTLLFFVLLVSPIENLIAQQLKSFRGPVFKEFGQIFEVENADLMLDSSKEYKVLFDVFTDDSKKTKINPLINTVARFINMHVHHGIPLKNLKIALVLHGAATKSALNPESFRKKLGYNNPDNFLIKALDKAQVEVFVCAQSYFAYGYKIEEKSRHVKLGLSALTVLTEYQSNGYQLINFN